MAGTPATSSPSTASATSSSSVREIPRLRWCPITGVVARGRGLATWHGTVRDPGCHRAARRFVRYLIGFLVLVFVLPVVIGLVLAATIGGWTSVAVAAVSWIGILVVTAVVARLVWRGGVPSGRWWLARNAWPKVTTTPACSTAVAAPFRPLTRSFNTMAERLETADGLRRRLLADVSHELRTPLTVLRGELEAIVDGVHDLDEVQVKVLLADVAAMERLLDDLGTLSSAETGVLTLHREPTETPRKIVWSARFRWAGNGRNH